VGHDAKSYFKHTLTYIQDYPSTNIQSSKQGTHFATSNTLAEQHPSSTFTSSHTSISERGRNKIKSQNRKRKKNE